jgi:hypothetical protein
LLNIFIVPIKIFADSAPTRIFGITLE